MGRGRTGESIDLAGDVTSSSSSREVRELCRGEYGGKETSTSNSISPSPQAKQDNMANYPTRPHIRIIAIHAYRSLAVP